MEKNTNNSPEEMEKSTNNSQSENSLSIPLYEDEPSSSSSLWDWSDLLDLSLDVPFNHLQNPLLFSPLHSYPILHPVPDSEPYPLQFDPINEPGHLQKHDSPRPNPNTQVKEHVQFQPDPIDGPGHDSEPYPIRPESVGQLGRVRKRDPRLTCENFLAGRVPCACPEMDALLLEGEEEEEEEGLPEKKRSRKRAVKPNKKGAVAAVVVRCQVAKCGEDISGLKGYHKRHRVCLGCANAKVVVLDGVGSRYCQQCGKFHILSDFDEGKRSCRRKLERHNNRRRRKSNDPSVSVEKESEGNVLSDDFACEDAYGKGRVPLSEPEEGKLSISVPCSSSSPQNVQSDSVLTFTASDETQIDFEKDESKTSPSNGYKDKKSDYSSVVPTGRISFKLYDWNPAEFPRRLRHQIFQWLASMPVELEGYIRPGCTILTAFVAMPSFMWLKVLQEPVVYVGDLVAGPGKMLSGRGAFLVYLDNMVFRVLRDGSSVMRIKVEERTPKLHYVRPACFEAGKPLEFVACGSNLLQPNFRFLVSFGGKYLAVDYSIVLQHTGTEEVTSSDNQLLKIYIPHTDPDLFGPAFIEVENQSGLSNFLPVLIGNQEICSEMKIIEQKLEEPISSRRSKLGVISSSSDSSEVSSRQASFSHFILDTAWLIRRPALEDIKHTPLSFQIGRLNNLLEVHIQNKSTVILVRVLDYIKTIMDLNSSEDGLTSTDVELLKNNVALAKQILSGTLEEDNVSLLQSSNLVHNATWFGETADSPSTYKDSETIEDRKMKVCYNFDNNSDTIALLNKDAFTNTTLMKEKTPTRYLSRAFTKKYVISRPLAFAVASASAVCFCVCAVFIHPQEVGKIVTTIRRSLFDNS